MLINIGKIVGPVSSFAIAPQLHFWASLGGQFNPLPKRLLIMRRLNNRAYEIIAQEIKRLVRDPALSC
ncbi:MAG: hypothetical protein AAFR26_24805 [Cyanobacteria bacterium J06626_4]